jgi:serine/threonine-protein kinase HipA
VPDYLNVILEGVVAGLLTRERGGRLRFEYSDEYRNRRGATPLSVSMPIQVETHGDRTVQSWLWGLLPENRAVVDRWTRQFHASSATPFSLLATQVGHDCAGAVQFARPDETAALLRRPGRVTWLDEAGVSRRLRDLKEDATAWLGRTFTGQFSLAGAQSKTALLYEGGRWGEPSGARPTTHILKPAVTGFDDHDLNEHLCMEAARRVGLNAALTRIVRFGSESAVVVERYDRIRVRGRLRRVHQEDGCQALGFTPARKYETAGGPGAVEFIGLFRRTMPPRAAEDAIRRFTDALIWNWLIVGTDAHAKNYALLLAGADVRMAPLYDVASALPYRMPIRRLTLAMRVGNNFRVVSYENPWPLFARRVDIDAADVLDRVFELASAAPDAFHDAAHEREVVQLRSPLSRRLVDAVAKRSRECLKLISRGRGN